MFPFLNRGSCRKPLTRTALAPGPGPAGVMSACVPRCYWVPQSRLQRCGVWRHERGIRPRRVFRLPFPCSRKQMITCRLRGILLCLHICGSSAGNIVSCLHRCVLSVCVCVCSSVCVTLAGAQRLHFMMRVETWLYIDHIRESPIHALNPDSDIPLCTRSQSSRLTWKFCRRPLPTAVAIFCLHAAFQKHLHHRASNRSVPDTSPSPPVYSN